MTDPLWTMYGGSGWLMLFLRENVRANGEAKMKHSDVCSPLPVVQFMIVLASREALPFGC